MQSNEIKIYLEAKSKDELIEKMLLNNRRHGVGFKYDSPIKEGKLWVVWFTANIAEYSRKDDGTAR